MNAPDPQVPEQIRQAGPATIDAAGDVLRDWQIAVHEAAHVVGNLALGGQIQDTLGFLWGGQGITDYGGRTLGGREDAIVSACGPMAEYLADLYSPPPREAISPATCMDPAGACCPANLRKLTQEAICCDRVKIAMWIGRRFAFAPELMSARALSIYSDACGLVCVNRELIVAVATELFLRRAILPGEFTKLVEEFGQPVPPVRTDWR